MAKLSLYSISTLLIIFLSITTQISSSSSSSSDDAATTTFIKSKCSNTTYPSLCFQSLSVYASTIQQSHRKLVLAALSVSQSRSLSEHTFIKKLPKFKNLKPIEYATIQDCIEEMSDDVDNLSKSVTELKNLGRVNGSEFVWHMSNIETWVSAALTDGTTCMDGFSGREMNHRIRWSIRTRITNVAKVTSNALCLVNQYAAAN